MTRSLSHSPRQREAKARRRQIHVDPSKCESRRVTIAIISIFTSFCALHCSERLFARKRNWQFLSFSMLASSSPPIAAACMHDVLEFNSTFLRANNESDSNMVLRFFHFFYVLFHFIPSEITLRRAWSIEACRQKFRLAKFATLLPHTPQFIF
jgi:hypothetical protein